MSTQTTPTHEDGTTERRFNGPWLRVLAIAVVAWGGLYALEWALLEAGTPAGAAVGFTHAYVLAPLATATILLDALSLGERGVADFGLFKWLYALVALFVPPIAVVYYAHREWLKPANAELLGDPGTPK
ncbi:hypothetical protein J2751_001912 [Halorubrum alkaliphilum]|uniref:Uncharacterized protein n=1 Tax=Halorubrum alkaliphilum TaxID=261290 RepID=A0A8T4GFD9_9EURY|nr:hypothetical protein [Halorubrum alkaliphilum]MBP1922896.1 hypothetical protein [Halorubrum alkaliphilum]